MKCLLLHDHDSKYDELLKSHNINPTNLPVLETSILDISKSDSVYQDFHPFCHNGVIITSKHGVTFLVRNNVDLNGKVLAVVGPSTVKLARKYSDKFDDVTVIWADNAAQLSHMIVTTMPRDYSWVFYCSSKALDIIPTTLSEHKIQFKQLVVYQVDKRTDLDQEILSLSDLNTYRAVVFFSPSGAEFTASILSRAISRDCVLVAFGKSTAKGITTFFGEKYEVKVCDRPTPEGVLDVLLPLL